MFHPRITAAVLLHLILACSIGCAGPEMAGADDVLHQKREGADDGTLLAWVQDSSRVFNLGEPELARLKQAGINEAVIVELRYRSEMYRRSVRPAAETQKPVERHAADGHRH